jgi:hypothetical protein
MVGRVGSFLDLIRRTQPELFEAFKSISGSFSTPAEREAISGLYAGISSSGFSDVVLSACTDGLAVLRCSGLGWSDLGEPIRVLSVLSRKSPDPKMTSSHREEAPLLLSDEFPRGEQRDRGLLTSGGNDGEFCAAQKIA